MRGMNSVRLRLASYTKNGMFPNFISDLSFSNCLLLEAAFSELLRCCLPGLESYTSPPNKIVLYFQVVVVFFSRQDNGLFVSKRRPLFGSSVPDGHGAGPPGLPNLPLLSLERPPQEFGAPGVSARSQQSTFLISAG